MQVDGSLGNANPIEHHHFFSEQKLQLYLCVCDVVKRVLYVYLEMYNQALPGPAWKVIQHPNWIREP